MPLDCDCNTALPYSVLRWIRAYRPRMRTAILRLLQDRMASGNDISQQDIFDCIGVACEMLEIEIESRVALPQPDTKTIEAAQEAAREGRGSTIDEILNGLS